MLFGRGSIRVAGLITRSHLCGLALPFPASVTEVEEKVAWAKQELESCAKDMRFRQFFAVYELEAWLLSDTGLFPNEVKNALPASLSEKVNSSEPPSKLIGKLYQSKIRKPYKKQADGEKFFCETGPKNSLSEVSALESAAGRNARICSKRRAVVEMEQPLG